jgi:hypothetical protein
MHIRIKEPCVVGGYTDVKVNDVLEVRPHIGHVLIGMGRAVEVTVDELKAPPPAAIQAREPVVEHRDPAPATKRSKGKLP